MKPVRARNIMLGLFVLATFGLQTALIDQQADLLKRKDDWIRDDSVLLDAATIAVKDASAQIAKCTSDEQVLAQYGNWTAAEVRKLGKQLAECRAATPAPVKL